MSVRLHEPTFGEEEIEAVVEVMRSTMVTQGKRVKEFEEAYWPSGHAVASNSGSSANLLAIAALKSTCELVDGDEVVVSALSWSTTVWPLVQHNLVPVLIDCDLDTLNMSQDAYHATEKEPAEAVMPVHVYGNPCDWLVLQKPNLLIEDCCEAMGAEYSTGDLVGDFGDIGTFSFYFSHHITTLEGGITVTPDRGLADRMRIQRSHGWLRDVEDISLYVRDYPDIDPRFLFVDSGYNLRMTEVQAAIGLVQLPKLPDIVEARRFAHAAYREVFGKYPYFRLQQETGKSSCFGFTVILDDAPFTAGDIRRYLEEHAIETRPIICGNLALQPGMKKFKHRVIGDLPNATKVMKDGFSIGCHQDISPEDIAHVAQIVEDFTCAH